jgi:hypothetical protein
MLATILSTRVSFSLQERWVMLYQLDYDPDGIMHPKILVEKEF